MSKVVIAGATGGVGFSAVEHFASLPDWEVVGLSRRPTNEIPGAKLVALDLSDADACREFADEHSDATHVVYAALYEKDDLVAGWSAPDQMQTNLDMLRNLLDPMIAQGNLQHVSVLQGTKAYGIHLEPVPVPARERWPRHQHDNFYWLQEDYLREKQKNADWHFTIWRPQAVFSRGIGANMNPLSTLGAYGAVLKAAGEPLHFPGIRPMCVNEATDAELLARAFAWATTAVTARNETFNITNGDVMVWQNVWPVVAESLGMEPAPARPYSFATDLAARGREWAAIVDEYDLLSPRDLKAFIGNSDQFLDFTMRTEGAIPPAQMSTIKLRQAGFGECIDTEDMLRKWFKRYQDERLLPPV